jgi:hypothetical protein
MSGILRTWHCQNSRCGQTFDAWEANPSCPQCKCVRVGWVPAGGHVGGAGKDSDRELRILADMFKLGDMNSAEEGRGAKKVRTPDAAPAGTAAMNFGGFAAVVDPRAGAQCVPAANKVDYKVKAAPDTRLSEGALGLPGVKSHTKIEATHRS